MAGFDPPFLDSLSETERIHFRNLALIRPQVPTDSQIRLVESLARTLTHPRLLTLIARSPHWLVRGQVIEALAGNEATPEPIRRELELVVSLLDLMHGMDKVPAEYREEQEQVVKAVYGQLPVSLRPLVKSQLKQMAKQVSATGATRELPPIPMEVEDWTVLTEPPTEGPLAPSIPMSMEARVERASTTHDTEVLLAGLLDEETEVRSAALRNPILAEEFLVAAMVRATVPGLFQDVYAEARWYFRDGVREAILESPACPTPLARKIRQGQRLREYLEVGLEGRRNLRRIAAHFTQLDESEYQILTYWVKHRAPGLLRVVKVFYDRLLRSRQNAAVGLRSTESRWASLEERVFAATQASAPDQLIQALRDPDPRVFDVVLENPTLTPREILSAIPGMSGERAEKLAHHRQWGEMEAVQEALLHNPAISQDTAMGLLPCLRTPKALMDLLRDSRLPHVAVQARALERLRQAFHELPGAERILLLRSHGGELLRHLAAEVLHDEPLLAQLLADRQLDPSLLLRLARNKQTPRAILERIASHPVPMAHPAILSELLLNPKTPRDAAIRVWSLLSETEQQALLAQPHLPATLRHLV